MIDPTLYALVEEQRSYLAEHGDHPADRPDADPANLLPVEVLNVAGVPVRILRPQQPRAIYLHFHAGSYVFGAAAMMDHANSVLARSIGAIVVSVDYRLVPAESYPAPIDDAETAALWLIQNQPFGALPMLIGGESVGATISLLTLLRLRDRSNHTGNFRGMNLIAGTYDFSMTPSQRLAPESYFLSPTALRRTQTTVFPGLSPEQLRDPAISPLYANLAHLPPALITVGTADSVLDDSLFLAARLEAAGGRAELQVYPEATHPFMTLPTAMAREAHGRVTRFLAAAIVKGAGKEESSFS